MVSEQEMNGSIAATRLLLQIDADRGLTPSATILAPLRGSSVVARSFFDFGLRKVIVFQAGYGNLRELILQFGWANTLTYEG